MKKIILMILLACAACLSAQDSVTQRVIELSNKGTLQEVHDYLLEAGDSTNIAHVYLYGVTLSKLFNSRLREEYLDEYKVYLKKYLYDFIDAAPELEKENVEIFFLAKDQAYIYRAENDVNFDSFYRKAKENFVKCQKLNAESFMVLANHYYEYLGNQKDWDMAVDVTKELVEIIKNGTAFHRAFAYQLVGSAYGHKMNNEQAVVYLEKSYELYQQVHPRTFNNYMRLTVDLGMIYLELGRLQQAETIIEECFNVCRESVGKESLWFVNCLVLKESLLARTNKMKEAREIAQQAYDLYFSLNIKEPSLESRVIYDLEYLKHLLGENASHNSPSVVNEDNQVLVLNTKYMQGARGEILDDLLNLKARMENESFENPKSYITVISFLSNIYYEQGDLVQMDHVLTDAEQLLNRLGLQSNPYYRFILNSRGTLCWRMKNYSKAIEYLEKAKIVYEECGDQGIEYIKMLNNLAISYGEGGNGRYAKLLLDYSVELFNQKINDLHQAYSPEAGLILNNIGYIYELLGDDEKAEDIFEDVVKHTKDNHQLYGAFQLAYNNLGNIYLGKGAYQKARDIFNELAEQSSDPLNRNVFLQNVVLSDLFIHANTQDEDLRKYNACLSGLIFDAFNNFSSAERERFWTASSREMLYCNNACAYKYNTDVFNVSAYDNLLFTKQMMMKSSKVLEEGIMQSEDKKLIAAYQTLDKINRQIYAGKKSSSEVARLYEQKDSLEKELLSQVPAYAKKLKESFPTFETVAKSLQENEVAVEFSLFPSLISMTDTHIYYAALILRKGWKAPKLVKLGDAETVLDLLEEQQMSPEFTRRLYTEHSPLFHLVYEGLLPFINEKDVIYYAPCGQLNKINLGAISYGGKPLSDRYTFKRVSSTANIAEVRQKATERYRTACLFGGIQYNLTDSVMLAQSNVYNYRSKGTDAFVVRGDLLDRGNWAFLPGSFMEVNSVRNVLRKKKIDVTLYSGSQANEESFKALNTQSPDILHLATHGYFYGSVTDIRKNEYLRNIKNNGTKESSLAYTGLLMAGSNRAWNKNKRLMGVEDGVLQASEIASLDLRNTKLAVLSACDTGLGRIDVVDGVFGLQRAFKNAGVQTILMSLWKVDDRVCISLMTKFYEHLLKGMSPHDALNKAVGFIRERHPEPYYWASFVLLD